MFKIGYRTIKTAVGAMLSMAIAQYLQLDFYSSAAIITILCISVTKKSSFKVSWQRLVACLFGVIFAFVFFETLGYQPVALGLLLVTFIPSVVYMKAKEGVVTSAVIILHIYTLKEVSLAIIVNELLLILIGIGVALLMNVYMPSVEKELKHYQRKVETKFKIVLQELAKYLREGDTNWDGKELTEVAALLDQAKILAFRNIENHILSYEDQYFHYFKMREKQFEVIERVMPFVSSIDDTVVQGEKIADFLEDLSEAIHSGNTAHVFLQQLSEMRKEFKGMDLPKDRKEFEIRSALFYFLHEMEEYLIIKSSLKEESKNRN